MRTTTTVLIALGLAVCIPPDAHGQRPDPPKQPSPPQVNVKTLTTFTPGTVRPFTGVVEKIDGTRVTVNCYWGGDARLRPRTFEAIDAVVDGTFRKGVEPGHAYRLSDLKAGDGVTVHGTTGQDDQVLYCVDVGIWRRPGAKLPKSRLPDKDSSYLYRCLLNDIGNETDVEDADIAKAFPGRAPAPALGDPGEPGGLDKEYQAKLDAIRAKKKDDVKAPPPEKKDR